MTDVLAGVDLHMVEGYTQQGRSLTIKGHHDTEIGRRAFEELFQDAETGSVLHTLPGASPVAEDLSDDERYTQLLNIPSQSKVIPGWYHLRGFAKGGDDYEAAGFAWQMSLAFIGSTAALTRGYDETGLDEVTNDWGI